jgi:hypothetical protein
MRELVDIATDRGGNHGDPRTSRLERFQDRLRAVERDLDERTHEHIERQGRDPPVVRWEINPPRMQLDLAGRVRGDCPRRKIGPRQHERDVGAAGQQLEHGGRDEVQVAVMGRAADPADPDRRRGARAAPRQLVQGRQGVRDHADGPIEPLHAGGHRRGMHHQLVGLAEAALDAGEVGPMLLARRISWILRNPGREIPEVIVDGDEDTPAGATEVLPPPR